MPATTAKFIRTRSRTRRGIIRTAYVVAAVHRSPNWPDQSLTVTAAQRWNVSDVYGVVVAKAPREAALAALADDTFRESVSRWINGTVGYEMAAHQGRNRPGDPARDGERVMLVMALDDFHAAKIGADTPVSTVRFDDVAYRVIFRY